MTIRLFRPPFLYRMVFRKALFRVPDSCSLFLTFDDGPDPESTPRILDILDNKSVNATFFCSGEKAEKYPELVAGIVSRGHHTGNHGYYHLSGWNTRNSQYIENVIKAAKYLPAPVFRPPYGRIKPAQYNILKKKLMVVFWDILGYDFDRDLSPDLCCKAILNRIRPGSVIVLHDTKDSSAPGFLGRFLERAAGEGYSFGLLPMSGKE